VRLPSTGQTGEPAAFLFLGGHALTDDANGGLKTGEISTRSYPYHAPAIWTPIPFQEKRLVETVKNSRDKAMAPDDVGATFRACFWPGPPIVAAPFIKLLENHRKKEYHITVLVRDPCGSPHNEKGGLHAALFPLKKRRINASRLIRYFSQTVN
jgi:hypothetical protein